MTCFDFNLECLQNEGKLSPMAREHLQSCSDCQETLRLNRLLLQPRPSPELDCRTLRLASEVLRQSRRRRWWQPGRRFLYAAAAALVLLLAVVALSLPRGGELPRSSEKAVVVLPQNPESSYSSHDLLILSYLEATAEMDDIEQQMYLYAGN